MVRGGGRLLAQCAGSRGDWTDADLHQVQKVAMPSGAAGFSPTQPHALARYLEFDKWGTGQGLTSGAQEGAKAAANGAQAATRRRGKMVRIVVGGEGSRTSERRPGSVVC